MTPTVGRIVHYHQEGFTEPLAAIITAVHPMKEMARLNVFWDVRPEDPVKDHENWIPQSRNPTDGHWTWPIVKRGS